MKKFIKTLAATVATVLVFGMTVCAAQSPSTNTYDTINPDNAKTTQDISKSGSTKGIDKDGNAFKFGFVALDKNAEQEFKDFAGANGYGAVVASFDLNAGGKTNFTAIFKITSVSKDAQLALLHKTNGTIHAHGLNNNGDQTWSSALESASPFAIVYGTASATAVVAPKTGEVIALAAILAIVMMAGAVVCARKARLQK